MLVLFLCGPRCREAAPNDSVPPSRGSSPGLHPEFVWLATTGPLASIMASVLQDSLQAYLLLVSALACQFHSVDLDRQLPLRDAPHHVPAADWRAAVAAFQDASLPDVRHSQLRSSV